MGNCHARCEPGESGENCKASSDRYLSVLIKTEKVKEYKTGQDYQVEVCHDKLFFIGEEGVLQVIDTDSVSM